MNTIARVCQWGDTHHPKWLDLLRIGLGLIIFYKGVQFARDPQGLNEIIEGGDLTLLSYALINYLPLVHLSGGVLIVLGLITRAAIIFQLPILLGAVVFSGKSIGFFDVYSGLGLTLCVLSLLIAFLIYGSGPFSLDSYMKKHPNS